MMHSFIFKDSFDYIEMQNSKIKNLQIVLEDLYFYTLIRGISKHPKEYSR